MVEIIAERYAKALFDAALDQGRLDETLNDSRTVRRVLDENPDLVRFCAMPNIGVEQKLDATARIFRQSIGEPLMGFLHVLIRADRTAHLLQVFEGFEDMYRVHNRQAIAVVTSAKALSEEELAKIRETLAKASGKEILLEAKVDPSLIGGVVVRLDDMIYDNSIKSQLSRLTRHLRDVRIN